MSAVSIATPMTPNPYSSVTIGWMAILGLWLPMWPVWTIASPKMENFALIAGMAKGKLMLKNLSGYQQRFDAFPKAPASPYYFKPCITGNASGNSLA